MSGQQLMTAACLGQRLVAAVEDVMELVRATVVQYEEESAHIRRENELLRSKLGEVVSLGITTEVVQCLICKSRDGVAEWVDWMPDLDQSSTGTELDQNQLSSEQQHQHQHQQNNLTLSHSHSSSRSSSLDLKRETTPTEQVAMKAEWSDHAPPDPCGQSQQSSVGDDVTGSDVIGELMLTRPIKEEPEDDVAEEPCLLIAMDTEATPSQPEADTPPTPLAGLEAVAIETGPFDSNSAYPQAPTQPRHTNTNANAAPSHHAATRHTHTTTNTHPHKHPLSTLHPHSQPSPPHTQLSASVRPPHHSSAIRPPHPTVRPPHNHLSARHPHPHTNTSPRAPHPTVRPPHASTRPPPHPAVRPPHSSSSQLGGPVATPSTHNAVGQSPVLRGPAPYLHPHRNGAGLGASGSVSGSMPMSGVASVPSAVPRGRARGHCGGTGGGGGAFTCPQCGKQFVHRSRLKVHLLIHTGERPYGCQRCGKRFNNDGTLKNHQRVHTQLRLYSCQLCPMRFKDAYTCRKHQATHTRHRAHTHMNAHTHMSARLAQGPHTHAQGGTVNAHTHTHTNSLGAHTARAQAQMNTHSAHTRQDQSGTHAALATHTHRPLAQTHTLAHPQNAALWLEQK